VTRIYNKLISPKFVKILHKFYQNLPNLPKLCPPKFPKGCGSIPSSYVIDWICNLWLALAYIEINSVLNFLCMAFWLTLSCTTTVFKVAFKRKITFPRFNLILLKNALRINWQKVGSLDNWKWRQHSIFWKYPKHF